MQTPITPLDIVALTEDFPERGLVKGQVGTVVEVLAPDVYEVEFSDNQGRTWAMVALRAEQLLVLRYEPAGLFQTGAFRGTMFPTNDEQ